MLYLTNAFSINMLSREGHNLALRPVTVEGARNLLRSEFVCAIGHDDTARVVGNILKRNIQPQRLTVELSPENSLLVAQYRGPRLAEGATELPEGATLEFWQVYHDSTRKVSITQTADIMQDVVGVRIGRIG